MVRWTRSLLCLGALLMACSGSGGGEEGAGAGSKYSSKRSPVCKTWQDAMCDFIADKCQAQSRAGCDELYQSLFCEDDTTMQTCISALGSATCGSPLEVPTQCKQINDPQPVGEFCQDFAREVCKFGVRCGEVTDQASCEAAAAVELAPTCNAGVGLAASADQCLADLPTAACSGSPSSCKGVIKMIEGTPAADVMLPWMTLSLAAPALPATPSTVAVPGAR